MRCREQSLLLRRCSQVQLDQAVRHACPVLPGDIGGGGLVVRELGSSLSFKNLVGFSLLGFSRRLQGVVG